MAIVFNLPEPVLLERNRTRTDRNIPDRVVREHCREVKRSVRTLRKEGFRYVFELHTPEEVERVRVVRTKVWNDRREEHGPFDVIGDIHGCCDELELLLAKLGYAKQEGVYVHPEGRKAAFLGDFCDRGPRNADTLRLVMDMVKNGNAVAVPGNHDAKLLKYLRGKEIARTHGTERTIAEMEARDESFREEVSAFLDGLVSHLVLDDGRLVIAHAGLKQEYIGRTSGKVRAFCLYGETTGETDTFGLPVRLDWAADYRGRATVVYGHVPSREVRAQNNTVCVDTGCVFGGKLTAYRYPERELVEVPALRQYMEPVRPLEGKESPEPEDVLSIGKMGKKLRLETELTPSIDIPEENSAAALEVLSRFAVDPRWLIYLPPTMSPCETSSLEGWLEHPVEAFGYYRSRGIRTVVCEKKHMGSRAVIVLARNPEAARKRFGVTDGTRGIVYTRTGREFFQDCAVEQALLERLDRVMTETGFWEDFHTDWVCLDTEVMPWSEKARGLLLSQYAPTGHAGVGSLSAAAQVLETACERLRETDGAEALSGLLQRCRSRKDDVERYNQAWRAYCWTVQDLNDWRIAPFHLLACEGKVFSRETHVWHMETIRRYMTGVDPIFQATPYLCVNTEEETSVEKGIQWWLDLTEEGGEGMVVKPETFVAVTNGQLIQPAVKCRGREYLRIIYGPEYLEEEHLRRLKSRSLSRKRALARKEFSLGLEGLKRFVAGESLSRVHECAFGVLALESEPTDPRL